MITSGPRAAPASKTAEFCSNSCCSLSLKGPCLAHVSPIHDPSRVPRSKRGSSRVRGAVRRSEQVPSSMPQRAFDLPLGSVSRPAGSLRVLYGVIEEREGPLRAPVEVMLADVVAGAGATGSASGEFSARTAPFSGEIWPPRWP
jgi:hypothetical protein